MSDYLDIRKAPDYFLQGCKNLGFREVDSLKNIVPCTIYRENRSKFILAVTSHTGDLVTIPVLILISLNKRHEHIIKKLANTEKFVIMHPLFMHTALTPAFAKTGRKYNLRRTLMKMLSGAAHGNKAKLRLLSRVLSEKCEEFFGQELLGFPQFPLIEECSDDDRDNHGACGPVAEENFLKAILNLNFNLVANGDRMRPLSIRHTTYKEEAELKDFIIRIPGYRQAGRLKKLMPIIPLQLTLMWWPKNKNLKRKLKAEKRGDIVLIWADESFGVDSERHTNLFRLLKDAADGKKEALRELLGILKEAFRRFYSNDSRVSKEEVERALSLI